MRFWKQAQDGGLLVALTISITSVQQYPEMHIFNVLHITRLVYDTVMEAKDSICF